MRLDETLTSIRDEMRKFAESDVVPHAQRWHRTNSYIPTESSHRWPSSECSG